MARVWGLACLCALIVCIAMPDHADRILQVRELRRLAGAYDVVRPRDNAGRQAVTAMAEAIRAAPTLSPVDKASFEQAWSAYEATFGRAEQRQDGGENAEQDDEEKAKWKCR